MDDTEWEKRKEYLLKNGTEESHLNWIRWDIENFERDTSEGLKYDSDRKEPAFVWPKYLDTDDKQEQEVITLTEIDEAKRRKVIDYLNHYAATRSLPHPSQVHGDHETMFKTWVTQYEEQQAEKHKIQTEKEQKSETRRNKANILKKIMAFSDNDAALAEIVKNVKQLELNDVLKEMLIDLEQQIADEEKEKNSVFTDLFNKMKTIVVDEKLVAKKGKVSPELNTTHPEGCNCTYCEEGWDVEPSEAVEKKMEKIKTSLGPELFDKCYSKKYNPCEDKSPDKCCDSKSPDSVKSWIDIGDKMCTYQKLIAVYVRIPDSLPSDKAESFLDDFKKNFEKFENGLAENCKVVYIPRRIEGQTEVQILNL